MARPIARGVLSFGLVAIPVELHTATHSQNVSFNLLHAKCGSRLKNRYLCPICNEVVERHQLVRGYEVEKGQYVRFTEAELETIEAEGNSNIELREFISIKKSRPGLFRRRLLSGARRGRRKSVSLARGGDGEKRPCCVGGNGEPRQGKTRAHPLG
jgi:DNA end-binding protein Ku